MKKGILSAVLSFVIALVAVVPAFAKQPVSTVVWNGETDKAVAANIKEERNDTRKNASGAKITSNAHSADFPGIYFIWDSKQKDNGYLKVEASLFNQYESFTLTAKESNAYWDFEIMPQEGQKKTADDCYVFFIPKSYNNKNINMVFVGEWKGKKANPVVVNLGFIGYYVYDGKVMSTSIHWQNLEKEGDCIDWAAADAAYSAWIADGGLIPERKEWQTSGYASFTFDDYTTMCFGDFNLGQLEDYYKAYYVDPGYVLISSDIIAYYAVCQLWNDLMWGNDTFGLTEVYTLTQDQKDLMMPVGIAHRTALQAFWNTEEMDVRYIPVSAGQDEFYIEWTDKIRYEGLQEVSDTLGIDIDEFIATYDTEGFLTRNNLW